MSDKTNDSYGLRPAYKAQLKFEESCNPTELKADIAHYIANDKSIKYSIKALASIIDKHDFSDAAYASAEFLTTETPEELSTALITTLLNFEKDFSDASELASRIATAITPAGFTKVKLNFSEDNCGEAMAAKIFALECLPLLADLSYIEIIYYPGNEEMGTTGWTMVKPKLLLTSGLRRRLVDSTLKINTSLVPFKPITTNNESPYISGNISYNIFNKAFMRDNSIVAPLNALNILHSMPVFVDSYFITEEGEKSLKRAMPRPYNAKGKQGKKNWKKQQRDFGKFALLIEDDPFFIKHTLDSKYRMYCSGSIKYQGTDFLKAALDLGEYELNDTNYEIVSEANIIQIANCLDFNLDILGVDLKDAGYDSSKAMDKHTFTERVDIVKLLIKADVLDLAIEEFTTIARKKKDHKAPVLQLKKAVAELRKIEKFNSTENEAEYTFINILGLLEDILIDVDLRVFNSYLMDTKGFYIDLTEFASGFPKGINTLRDVDNAGVIATFIISELYRIDAKGSNVLELLLFFVKREGLLKKKAYRTAIKLYKTLKSIPYDKETDEVVTGHFPLKIRGMIALDATCSFAQIMALLSGHDKDGLYSNLLGEGRIDLYTEVYKELIGDPAFKLKGGKKLTRLQIKDAVMQTVYGSAKAWKILSGSNAKQSKLNKEAFYRAMETIMPGSMAIIKHIRNNLLDATSIVLTWTMPDEVEARAIHTTDTSNARRKGMKLSKMISIPASTHQGQTTNAVVELTQHRPIADKGNISLIALLIQSFDSLIAREMVIRCKLAGFNIFMIHDSFSCQYQYAEKMSEIYQSVLMDILEGDWMNEISLELSNNRVGYKKSEALGTSIKEASDFNIHALC